LFQTQKRLSRNLGQEDMTDRINERISWEGAGRIGRDTVLAVDLGDVTKKYAEKMEHQAGVRDGSEGELGTGYWLMEIIGADVEGTQIVPMYGELYSQNAPGHQSENTQILKGIEQVAEQTQKRGIFALDRGGDRDRLLNVLLHKKLRFVIRQTGARHVVMPGGRTCRARTAAQWCHATVKYTIEVEREGYRETKELELGAMPVRLPGRAMEPLWLVVIRGFGREPILLLTNVLPEAGRAHPKWIADIYLTRWKCEETFRFLKQAYRMEDVRVRRYVAIRNTYALVHAVVYFVSVWIGAKQRLNILVKRLCEKAKRFFEVATFFHYAVADGIRQALFGSGWRQPPEASDSGQRQLAFAFATPPPPR
jgi:hypothetical protein